MVTVTAACAKRIGGAIGVAPSRHARPPGRSRQGDLRATVPVVCAHTHCFLKGKLRALCVLPDRVLGGGDSLTAGGATTVGVPSTSSSCNGYENLHKSTRMFCIHSTTTYVNALTDVAIRRYFNRELETPV